MKYTIAGDIEDALIHFAAVGAALIAQEQTGEVAHLWWEDGTSASAQVEASSGVSLGEAVVKHAARHAQPESWVEASHLHEGSSTATFSPRIKAAKTPDSWANLLTRRYALLDDPALTPLDFQMLGALGEPAWWLTDQPDKGASRWEMKTRNRGEEFVGNRLRLLAEAVSRWSPDQAAQGVMGGRVHDQVGNDSAISRTATGLRRIGPTDNALAWCALWGLAATTLIPQVGAFSQTSGAYPRDRVAPAKMAVPVFSRPVTPARWSGVLASRSFEEASFASQPTPSSRAWLGEAGVVAIVRFPTEVVGSASAPERRLLRGTVEVLRSWTTPNSQ